MKTNLIIRKIALGILALFSLSVSAQTFQQTKPADPALFEWTDMPAFSTSVSSSIATPDGGWVIGGMTAATQYYYYPPIVIKLSSSGEKLWQYPQNFEWEVGSTDVIKKSADGNLLIGGLCMAGCDYGPLGTFLHKISEDGQVIWKKIFVTENYTPVADVFESANGEIFVVAGTQMLKVSSAGDTSWVCFISFNYIKSTLGTRIINSHITRS